jgi:haloacetate dehalogenase
MFEGFTARAVETTATRIFLRIAGDGPPLLLLHGYPQTHAMWHKVAPALAERFTVICADLRGYGDSGKPETDPAHATYSKRAMASDMVAVMRALGFERFMVAGHDRGARVAHRMCLDHKDRILKVAFLDIVPTRTIFRATDMTIAMAYYHWFFLAQPAPLPERLIAADPAFYLRSKLARWSAGELGFFDAAALAEYERCFADPATIHATCEDYRAAATIDLEHDHQDVAARIACPVLALWGEKGLMHRHFDVRATWLDRTNGPVDGLALPTGHFLAEERPDLTTQALLRFFGG